MALELAQQLDLVRRLHTLGNDRKFQVLLQL